VKRAERRRLGEFFTSIYPFRDFPATRPQLAFIAPFDTVQSMDIEQIRRMAITALFSDDVLVEKLVLKGGNALRLVYGIGSRSSMDIDLSIDKDFENFEDIKKRLNHALTSRFDSVGYVVFDFSFDPKPFVSLPENPPSWGGYELFFKLMERTKYDGFKGDMETIRRNANRKFSVEFSKFEYVGQKAEIEWDDGFIINVYTLPMIAVEKLRAICQQMPVYEKRRFRTPRARDFYDIFMIVDQGKVDLLAPENVALVAPVFAAKEVPLSLLSKIADEREFHRGDWPRVEATVSGVLKPFDFYFDFVVTLAKRLEVGRVE
jgi:predicted nucleotidyltransferase component of viral defense system